VPFADTPDFSQDIWIGASVVASGGSGACQWRKVQVRAAWWTTSGHLYDNMVIGHVWMMHLYNWGGMQFSSNATYQMGAGGWVHWIDGLAVGQVYPSGGSCSGGPHVHVEMISTHAFGASYEWHEADPGQFYTCGSCDYQPFNDLQQFSPHVHKTYTPCCSDSVSTGQTLMFLGGGYPGLYGWWNWDNPWTSDH
jgi:hypothetical protein